MKRVRTLGIALLKEEVANWTHIPRHLQEAYIKRIGNLTLLDKKLNEDAGNVSFAKKKEAFGKSEIKITKELADSSEWTIEAIEERQKGLADIAVKVWPAKPKS